jgi:hypothetical protein
MMFDVEFLGFPRRTAHVLLPESPVAAAHAGLALYDSTLLHQRVVRALGTALLTLRLHGVLRLGRLPESLVDRAWWVEWCEQVAAPHIGPVTLAAFRLWEGRTIALLMTAGGEPRGFVKVWPDPPGPPKPHPYLQPIVLRHLADASLSTFRIAPLLAEGTVGGCAYQLFAPLPAGAHHPAAADPTRMARIFDEMHARLADVRRDEAVPAHYVIGHGDFTPRNVRDASDGRTWVLDWEYACWSPRLVDELQFWTAFLGSRVRPRPERDGRRVLALLRDRGSDEDIAEALRWNAFMTSEQAAIARVVDRELGAVRERPPRA